MRRWQRGDVVVRREVWRGHPWAAIPAVVVRDEPSLIALYVPEGAPFGFAEAPVGRHPWADHDRWEGHGVLMLHRPRDPYALFVFWRGEPRAFSQWYLNFQAPLARTRIGFDTLDHDLDAWSLDAKTWRLKDDDALELRVHQGRYTPTEATKIRWQAQRALADLDASGPWWDEAWARWTPDRAWQVPALLPDWASEPPAAAN